jgi:hypothetical protein
MIRLLSACMAVFLAASCASYTPSVNLPSDVKTVAVPIYVNKTDRYEMEQYVTQKTLDEFLKDGKVSIADEKTADAIIKCRLKKYVLTPTRFDINQIPQEYMLRIYMDVYFFDNRAQRLLWKDENLWEETRYYVVNDIGMPVEDEAIGRNRVLDKLAGRVLRRVVYGW